ncbi:MAG: iron-containing redox enzyme family protein [Pseudorhodobacter sp.]|nr:iron-containing redox enzyme family protein [Pseudorhodobacter sp.]
MRSYQGRFVLLPDEPIKSVVARMRRYYDPIGMMRLDSHRAALETALIGPIADVVMRASTGQTCADYVTSMLDDIQSAPPGEFLSWLDGLPDREHHYRNFLIQSATDLLAEASASALGVIGEFGPPQSALFRILIDEFGYGVHDKKHSVLYRKTLRGFELSEQYNFYWPLFDTPAITLHNVIHALFHSPRNFFRQIGFLLFAETSYQRSTGDHYRYLRKHHPSVDATYFGEHAHIDIHHSAMVVNEVVTPLVAQFGEEVGQEIIVGAELTKAAFGLASQRLLAISRAFDDAARAGDANYGLAAVDPSAECATPDTAAGDARYQVGGLGQVSAAAFARFPPGAIGRRI